MNVLLAPAAQCLGWTLLHFLWQGAFLALAGKLVLWALRRRSAQARYLAGCATMACLVLAPVATFHMLSNPGSIPRARSVRAALPAWNGPAQLGNSRQTEPWVLVRVVRMPGAAADVRDSLEARLPWFLVVWASGVVLLAARMLAGWCQVHRWTRGGVALSVPGWEQRLGEVAMRLRVTRPVRLLESALVEVPTVLGWFRPVVLLPASCLTGLSSTQLEAILAHELAHIRRHDYLVNVLQRMVETLLFYHPAVWWVSGQIRIEREHCCDDWVVAACGDRVGYARALASLEEMRDASGQFALAAAGRPLLTRIRRLLGKPIQSRFDGGWIAGMLAIAALALSLVAGRGVLLAQAQRQSDTASQTEMKDPTAAIPEPTASNPAKAEVTLADPERPQLFTRTFKLPPDAFQKYFERQERGPHGKSVPQTLDVVLHRPGPKPPMSELLSLFFLGAGVDFGTNVVTSVPAQNGDKTFVKALFINEQTGLLLARATLPELDTVEKAIQLVATKRPQVLIEIQFTEIDPAELAALGLNSLLDAKSGDLPLTITNWNGTVTDPHAFEPGKNIQDFIHRKAELLPGAARVVAPPQARAILERIRGDILSAPRITTLSGQRAQIQVVEPTNNVFRDQLGSLPRATGGFFFAKGAVIGNSVDLLPNVSADGLTIQLTATPCVTEFLGYDDSGPFSQASDADGKPLVASLPLPRFRARQVTVNAVIPDGHTLVIAGFGPAEAAQPDQPNGRETSVTKPQKQLLIFVTPTIIDARGNRVHPD